MAKFAKSICMLVILALAAVAQSAVFEKKPCGTLDLTSGRTQHCFPPDASHHSVCCVDIKTPDNNYTPSGNYNPLGSAIRAASRPSSYSWCTCSKEICTAQLGGRVAYINRAVAKH
mmetsp:Transcript_14955/g.40102  ORF Transcript_14955/g.40102 Transcript_14955/m.40102 type:complete len:116 (-) Transcript_14955:594-941(-)